MYNDSGQAHDSMLMQTLPVFIGNLPAGFILRMILLDEYD